MISCGDGRPRPSKPRKARHSSVNLGRPMNDKDLLLDQFVSSFEKLDEMTASKELSPLAWELAAGKSDDLGWKRWRPIKVATDPSCLEPLYAKLPARFPRLFEHLVLSYRWADVELKSLTLLANPRGSDLSRFWEQISSDPGLWTALITAGYIRFGRGADMDFDPVCFDVKTRRKNGDCRIVKIDHEEILCNNRVKVVAEIAPSFEALVEKTIELAKSR